MAGKPTFSFKIHRPNLLQATVQMFKLAIAGRVDKISNPLVSSSVLSKRLPKHTRWYHLGRHQGEKECARRRAQISKGMMKITG